MPSRSAFVLGPHACGSELGFAVEWLVADGIGGYATGTVAGLRTRRYHALLVTPTPRRVALVSLDPTLTLPSGATIALGVHEWASGALDPRGHCHLERFDLVDGLPRWRWRVGETVLERELAMVHGRSAVGVVHRLLAGPAVRVTLAALCTWRDADGERDRSGPGLRVVPTGDGAVVEGAYRLAGPGWRAGGDWWVGAHARQEAARGLTATEDLWWAGTFSATIEPGETLEVSAWAGDLEQPPPPPGTVVEAARKRARKVVRAAKPTDDIDATLALAADAFVINGADGPDVVAGYPWFGCHPRDTLTAYEGLFLHTGQIGSGRTLLRLYGGRARDGFDDAPDAALWFAHAVDRHVAATGDTDLAAELLPVVEAVLTRYSMNNGDSVLVDPGDGLLAIEADRLGLTWMNARLPGGPVTPRDGKPIELNALWANALGAAVALREAVGRDPGRLVAQRDAVRAHFGKRYPAPGGWLFDVVDARPAAYPLGGGSHHDDPVLRPNQLLAYSLPHAPLPGGDPRVLPAVGEALLTPLGLRTLAPGELGYHGTAHCGRVEDREAAYHQGSVWPWLIGPYTYACHAAGLPVTGLLGALEAHLGEAGLGSVSEIADGDPPHHPAGGPFSARSVAELIRSRWLTGNVHSRRADNAIR